MNKILVALCGSLISFSLNGSAPAVPDEMAAVLNGTSTDISLEKLKEWSQAFPSKKEFAAYSLPRQKLLETTLLHRLTMAYPKDNDPHYDTKARQYHEMIDFLLNECEADPDAGFLEHEQKVALGFVMVLGGSSAPDIYKMHTSPYELAKGTNISALVTRYDKAKARIAAKKDIPNFLELYGKWKRQVVQTDEIIQYFTKYRAHAPIDQCDLGSGRTVYDDLESMRTPDAQKILAYAAPYQCDKVKGLKHLVKGIVEHAIKNDYIYTLTNALKESGQSCDIDTLTIDGRQPISLYLYDNIRLKQAKELFDTLKYILKEQRTGLPASVTRIDADRVKYGPTDNDIVQLFMHCAQHTARMDELRDFLDIKKECLLDQKDFEKEVLEKLTSGDDATYPHKAEVLELLENHTLIALLKKASLDDTHFEKFKSYFEAHPRDIDTIAPNLTFSGSQSHVLAFLEPYRSNPNNARELCRYVRLIIKNPNDGWALDNLRALLQSRAFNIDLIPLDPAESSETIAEVLERPKLARARTKIFSCAPITDHRSAQLPIKGIVSPKISGAPSGRSTNKGSQKNQNHLNPSSSQSWLVKGLVLGALSTGFALILYYKHTTKNQEDSDEHDTRASQTARGANTAQNRSSILYKA